LTDRRALFVVGHRDGDDASSVPYVEFASVDLRSETLTRSLVVDTVAGSTWKFTVREAADAADAIVAAAEDHDFVALGATRERRFRNRVVGSVARSVGRRATPPVVIAKRPSGASLRERVFGRWW
jgi:nucleotide-binding universal stress UspA family protein